MATLDFGLNQPPDGCVDRIAARPSTVCDDILLDPFSR